MYPSLRRSNLHAAAAFLGFLIIPLLAPSASAQDNEIGFIERFALAEDRTEALKELIPGTEDFYFFHALHYQNTGDRAGLDGILEQWKKRFENSQLRKQIENREALLRYDANPQATLDYLKRELGLAFNHQREQEQTNPDLPTALDQALIAMEAIVGRSLQNGQNLGEVSDAGIDWLMLHWGQVDLTPAQKRELLGKLKRPDYPALVDALVEDLATRESRGFGEFPVHAMLLPDQLDALQERRPALLGDSGFVLTKLGKLRPGADVDMTNDTAAREAYLDRAWGFVSGLETAFHSLQAHVLFQRLTHDRAKGEYDRERFLAYLRLPRPVPYINPRFRDESELWRHPVDLNFDASPATGMPPIGNDDALVRDYLLRFLTGADGYEAFAPFLTDDYLKPLLAEANIVGGHGDPEKWASLLTPAAYQQLKERVDLDFDPACKERFGDGETVNVDLHVKNVQDLIVKVYEVNTFNYFLNFGQQINTDLNLDGLVANEELAFDYDSGPFRRVRRHFEFAQLNASRGVWVVEFIGNGKSSRALIRKGNLQYVTRPSTAGNALRILDDKRQLIPGAYAWLNGRRHDQDDNGEIIIPFSNQPGIQQVILADGQGFAALENVFLQGENYSLSAGFYVDREELLATRDATLAVRPNFTLNGSAADLELLEEVVLTIVSTDLDGVQSTVTVPEFKLFAHKESTHTLRVPERLASLQFQLSAKVKNLSKGTDERFTAQDSVAINQIAATDAVADLFLSRIDGAYQVQVLGRTGEAVANTAVNFSLRRDDFRTDVQATLKTDAAGAIDLGPLDGIYRVRATATNGRDYRWVLPADRARYPGTIHARAGEEVSVPVMRKDGGREAFSLLEMAHGSFVRDYADAITVRDGFATLRNLPAGDYSLLVKEAGREVTIRVSAGEAVSDFLLSDARNLELRNVDELQIRDVRSEGDNLVIVLANANSHTRVHLFSSRYVPAFDAFERLGLGDGALLEPLSGTPSRFRNLYVSGRSIGDEYRYVIERRFARRFPGNMLKRPGLLLNPWALRDTATALDEARSGQDWNRSDVGAASAMERKALADAESRSAGTADPHALDFLAEPAGVSFNIAPGDDGVLRVKLEELGDRQFVRVLATDPHSAVERSVALPARDTAIKDLRLAKGLNPKRHYTQQDQVTILEPGKAFVIDDVSTAGFEAYETVGSVYQLLKTLSGGNATLDEFSFITGWPDLDDAKKRELYSKYACHELSVFLERKDPEFFAGVVQPYLRNKKDKTFIDHYLLGDDMAPYLQPWRYAQLNVVERILLAERLPQQMQSIARDVNDWLALLPPELRLDLQNFDTALAGSALMFGFAEDAKGLRSKLKAVEKAQTRGAEVRFRSENGVAKLGELQMQADFAAAPAAPAPAGQPGFAGGAARELAESEALAAADGAEAGDKSMERLARRSAGEEQAGQAAAAGRPGSDAFGIAGKRMDADRDARQQLRQFYRKLEETREWAENNYYQLPIEQQNRELVTVNKFWDDFASRDPQRPFLSRHIAEASRNFTEMMLALSVLDLPFKAVIDDAATSLKDTTMTLTPASPVILFHKEIKEAVAAGQATPLLVSQNFFRQGDRYVEVDGERSDKFVTDEFLTGVVYGCQIVVTNPTSSMQRLDLMQQIPMGAIPVSGSKATANMAVRLDPYQTFTQEYHFYFPGAGDFAHFPVHVSKDQKVVAFAAPFTFHVVNELSNVDTASWAYLSQWGTPEQVLEFLDTHNIRQIDLDRIAWRCRESDSFFSRVVAILDDRHHYDPTIYSYGIHHNQPEPMRQFLLHADGFLAQCGDYLDTRLVTIDPVARRNYQHLEYSPLVNARSYALGGVRKILNDRFRAQYQHLMRILSCRAALDATDRMTLTCYLLLQDRIEEALASFARVERESLPTQLQYDYLSAYTSFYREDPGAARAIAEQYADYPVERWQKVFHEVAAQLDEIEGKKPQLIDEDDRAQQQNQLASTEPAFTFKVEDRKVDVLYRNLDRLSVNYYRMDLELLFSTNPFVSSDSARFSIIKPNRTDHMALDAAAEGISFALPAEFEGENVLVEIVAAGIRKAQAYYSNSLNVQLAQNYGHLQVTQSQDGTTPIAKAYVKVYAEIDGTPRFYKDGYTDLRGKFDYASLNTSELDSVARFSILVMSDDRGAVVTEAKPPQR